MAEYFVEDGETIQSIAYKFGLSASVLREINGLSSCQDVHKGQGIKIRIPFNIKRKMLEDYIVQPGDTLTAISAKYKCQPKLIQIINNIENPDYIQVGQHLNILTRIAFEEDIFDFYVPACPKSEEKTLIQAIKDSAKSVNEKLSVKKLFDKTLELLSNVPFETKTASVLHALNQSISGDPAAAFRTMCAAEISFQIMNYLNLIWALPEFELWVPFVLGFCINYGISQFFELFK